MADLNPSVRRVLDALAVGGECSTAELADSLGVHQTTVSRDMRTLVDRGLAMQSGRRANTFLYRAVELTSGPPKPVPAARCTCGDLVKVHALNGRGLRAKCSAMGCGCRLFVKAGAVNGRA